MKLGDSFCHIFNVNQEVYDQFISLSQDRNPMHCDDTFAQNRGFKSKIMHGNILNTFISFFVGECLLEKSVVILSQTIKYKNPFYLNDVLTFNSEITGVFDSVNVYEFKFQFTNSDGVIVSKGSLQISRI